MWASCLTDSIKEWSCRRHCRKMAMQFRSVSLFRSMMFLACQGWGFEPRPQIQLKFWTPKYDCTPVPRCMKLSSTKRWPWSFRGSCCRRAPEPLLLDTAQRCVKKQGSLFLRPFCWTVQFWHRKVKIGLKMVGSSNAISNCPISWLWVKRICIRKTGLVNTKALPCWDKTTHIRTCFRQSRYFAPRFSFRCSLRPCRRFCWKLFFFGVCIFSQPRNGPYVIISYRILIIPIFTI